VKRFPLLRVL
jgi:hypothetical protein